MSYVLATGFTGMGDSTGIQKGITIGTGAATPAVAGALSAWAAAAGPGATILGMAPALAIPLVGAALVGVATLATILIKNSGCGQTCIQTSQWANQAADALQQNLDAYNALPVPRSASAQALALQNFDSIWARLTQMCGDPQWGDAGKRCISDRQRGACTWKNNGQCWDWFIGYRDPIANDPNVAPDHLVPSDVLTQIASGGGSSLLPLALIAGLVILGVAL